MFCGMSYIFQQWHVVHSRVLTGARRLVYSDSAMLHLHVHAPIWVRTLTSSRTIKTRIGGRLFDKTSILDISCVHRPVRYRPFAMAARDVSDQSNIHKMKTESDGSFKRQASSFRDVIERGGKYEPEPGTDFV